MPRLREHTLTRSRVLDPTFVDERSACVMCLRAMLASEHIATLRAYCKRTIAWLLECRKRKRAVVLVTARVKRSMLKTKSFHRFEMLGFHFELREGATKQKARKREFVLNFARPAGLCAGGHGAKVAPHRR